VREEEESRKAGWIVGSNRNWSQDEENYLSDKWGTVSVKSIAKYLNRTEGGVINKAERMKLGSFLGNGEYVTWHQLLIVIGIEGGSGYKNRSWIKNRNFPIHTKKVRECSFKVVYINEFWKWAEKNQSFIDFSNFEENSIGEEPRWVKDKRRHDIEVNRKYIKTPWTKTEDERLKKLLKDYKYTYDDLSKMIRRTTGAIQRRVCDLKIKERPVKADNHIKWTDEEYKSLWNMLDGGYSYELMAEKIGKSSKAIRGRVYSFYGTENLDKVREVRKLVS
jgi:hypothetical protein